VRQTVINKEYRRSARTFASAMIGVITGAHINSVCLNTVHQLTSGGHCILGFSSFVSEQGFTKENPRAIGPNTKRKIQI
jgi:hypothetical protein